MTLLIALGAMLAGCIRWRTRLGAASPTSHRSARQRWLRAFRRPMPMPHRLPRTKYHHALVVAAGGAVSIPVLLGEARST
jgi:hypothetical protein